MGRIYHWIIIPSHLIVLTLLLLLAAHVEAVLVNVTVDDDGVDSLTGSMILYEPSNGWSVGQNCSACQAQPDRTRAWNNSWHDGTYTPGESNATFQFTGTALWVFCILAPSNVHPGPMWPDSDMTFYIDGSVAGIFHQAASTVPAYTPNYPVFQTASMPNAAHTFVLQNGQIGSTHRTLVLLDYLIYSYDDSYGTPAPISTQTASLGTSSKSKSTHTIAIVVPVVIVAALIALGACAYFWRRRRHLRLETERMQQSPVAYTVSVPPITVRRARVIPAKGNQGAGVQSSPVATDANGASGSGMNLMSPDSYVHVQAEDAGPPSYHE
ncbi:hypothetical protein EIP91_000951 [Steccherinum ochraceum]|uniref:Uncharacterized protein n=1 Tax=Steccherinum ochraceum TaxID=92696 RepID=A0A4R0RET7_9APHY|nr:hypothetical protein EIP91_000951 [Steccherinum ochraceum]